MKRLDRSLEPVMLSTRAKNALRYWARQHNAETLEDIINLYSRDPRNFEESFIRSPGVGITTFDQVRDLIRRATTDERVVGRVTLLARHRAEQYSRSIDTMLARVASSDQAYNDLRVVQELLASSVVMIEQRDDQRPEFKKIPGKR